MKSLTKLVLPALLLALITSGLTTAQDEEKKKKQRGNRGARALMARYKNIDLSEEQKEKITKIVKEFNGKLAEIRKGTGALLSKEQRQARQKAMKEAREAGKSGKELNEAANKAAGISAETLAKMQEAQKKSRAVQAELRKAIEAVLTDEQKKSLPKPRNQKGKKGKKKKKDDA